MDIYLELLKFYEKKELCDDVIGIAISLCRVLNMEAIGLGVTKLPTSKCPLNIKIRMYLLSVLANINSECTVLNDLREYFKC